ncbi:TIGR03364 family FAD-dependent oxidoreductase [Planctomycetaceae bacterium SH139]
MRHIEEPFDIAVVGAGIVGLGTAWAAAKRGAKVALFESSPRACGGSVRNFGMVWPIGQPAGERYATAVKNRDLWLSLAAQAGLAIDRCGSLHLAHHEDEWATLQEFANAHCDPRQPLRLLGRRETLAATSAANPDGMLGSLQSDDECRVDPRQAIGTIPTYLETELGVQCHFGTTIAAVEAGGLISSDGSRFAADQIVICSGADFARLFPRDHAASGLFPCKLQMMRTVPIRSADNNGFWRLGPHLASGLTLRHYEAFAACPSQQRVRQRIAEQAPELDRYGIHVMVSQSLDGELVLGDSHEYGAEIEPFDKAIIDRLMLRELAKVFSLPTWEIQQRWSGIYAKLPDRPYAVFQPAERRNVTIINGFGGAGMSLSLAVTDEAVSLLLEKKIPAAKNVII